ncbi:MAG TPA: alpha/beta hydrolase [Candidatus Kapabacteria bacterium]|nr:alpha/beta hydrolase [Candidatus Kapabacteria bacterium]
MSFPPEQINCVQCGSGPPVVLVHGNPGTHSVWRPVAERLSAERMLFTPDLPGFGGTPAPADAADYGVDRLATAILGMAANLGLERFDLVGHSFGGAIAITMASIAPERVRTLTAITPMSSNIPSRARLARMPLVVPIISGLWHIAPGWVRRRVVRSWTHVTYDKGYIASRSEEVARESDRAGLIRSVAGLVASTDYSLYDRRIDALQELAVPPVLLIGSGRDRVIPHSDFVSLVHRLARARVHTFPEGGHVPIWQYPDELCALLRGFWDEDLHGADA